jgi:hypothetical protein
MWTIFDRFCQKLYYSQIHFTQSWNTPLGPKSVSVAETLLKICAGQLSVTWLVSKSIVDFRRHLYILTLPCMQSLHKIKWTESYPCQGQDRVRYEMTLTARHSGSQVPLSFLKSWKHVYISLWSRSASHLAIHPPPYTHPHQLWINLKLLKLSTIQVCSLWILGLSFCDSLFISFSCPWFMSVIDLLIMVQPFFSCGFLVIIFESKLEFVSSHNFKWEITWRIIWNLHSDDFLGHPSFNPWSSLPISNCDCLGIPALILNVSQKRSQLIHNTYFKWICLYHQYLSNLWLGSEKGFVCVWCWTGYQLWRHLSSHVVGLRKRSPLHHHHLLMMHYFNWSTS